MKRVLFGGTVICGIKLNEILLNHSLLESVRAKLENFDVRRAPECSLRKAAVAITIVNLAQDPAVYNLPYQDSWANHAAIILTKRPSTMRKHAGQWALPGGAMDEGETAEQTALRELSEEVGLELGLDSVIGRLDDYKTRSGFVMTPVVVWGGTDPVLCANPAEVASIHRIAISEFMREDAPMLKTIPQSDNPVLLMPVGDSWIAAPTAAILYQFREVAIRGLHTRVSHYVSPHFARK